MIPTTVVRLQDSRLQTQHQLWTTLEGENPGGSIKDRMVVPELQQLRNVKQISEISAGSTALSLAYHSKQLNIGCHLFIPNNADVDVKNKLLALGVTLTECDPATAYSVYEKFCAQSTAWPFKQMQRKELREHYRNWAYYEIFPQLNNIKYVIGAIGTGHSLLGVSEGLKPSSGCIAIEPMVNEPIHGIRNLKALNFGAEDPCDLSLINERIEISLNNDGFSDHIIHSSHGKLIVSDSFRLTLKGALSFLKNISVPTNVFLIGSHCKRA